MQLATDYIHPAPRGGRCRVRVFLPDEPERDAPVIVCTELANNPGQSVTNAAPRIAAEVLKNLRLPVPVVWIEHYEDGARGTREDPETFDLVVFEDYRPRAVADAFDGPATEIGPASWRALDRGAAETLVGRPL